LDSTGKRKIKLDYVIEIDLDRETAKKRIMGRRLCKTDNNHPNNIYIDAIKPHEKDGKLPAVSAVALN
jgi:adenylate kinase